MEHETCGMQDLVHRAAFATFVSIMLAGCGGGGVLPNNPQPPGSQTSTARDDWPMYGHDARHTSASVAIISGPLKTAWRYDPKPLAGNTFETVFNSIATVNGVYVHWQQYGSGVFSGGPSFDGVSTSGQPIWDFVEHRDYDEGHWACIYNSAVVFNDDGQGFLNISSGVQVKTPGKTWGTGYDLWGESIPDSSGLYMANTFLADGADLFVYSLDSTGAARWTQNHQKSTKYSQDSDGGLLLSNGIVFYAAEYSDPSPFVSGVYALDATSGHQNAFVSTSPTSEMSADATNIYLIEGSKLVARAQSNLSVAWSASVATSSTAAPVVANGLVIVATASGIEAHRAATGKTAWISPVSPAYGSQYSTAMSAALGSNTLLVTAYDGLHVLSLANGHGIWRGAVAGAVGTVVNPVIVNDPTRGAIVYVTDSRGVIALVPG